MIPAVTAMRAQPDNVWVVFLASDDFSAWLTPDEAEHLADEIVVSVDGGPAPAAMGRRVWASLSVIDGQRYVTLFHAPYSVMTIPVRDAFEAAKLLRARARDARTQEEKNAATR